MLKRVKRSFSPASFRAGIAAAHSSARNVFWWMLVGGVFYAASWYNQRRALFDKSKPLAIWGFAKFSLITVALGLLSWIALPDSTSPAFLTGILAMCGIVMAIAGSTLVIIVPFYGWWFALRWNKAGLPVGMQPLAAFLFGPWYLQRRINQYAGDITSQIRVIRPAFSKRSLVGIGFAAAAVMLVGGNWATIEKTYYLQTATDTQRAMAASINGTDEGLMALAQTNGQIVDAAAFRDACIDGPTENLELGCYYTVIEELYVLDVQDPRLEAVEKSVTAHEILHHVYHRSSDSEKKRLDTLAQAEATKFANDPFFRYLTEPYKGESPDVYRDELHSLLSAMNADLAPELEAHYAQYFDRSVVRSSYQVYYQALKDVENEIDTLEARLKTLEGQITAIDNRLTSYESRMDLYLARNEYDAYNGLVSPFNNNLSQMKRLINEYETTYERYERIYQSYTAIFKDIQLGNPSDISSLVEKY